MRIEGLIRVPQPAGRQLNEVEVWASDSDPRLHLPGLAGAKQPGLRTKMASFALFSLSLANSVRVGITISVILLLYFSKVQKY